MLIALAAAQRDWVPATPSIHGLGLGLPGYLILFAPLAFAPQRQLWSSAPLSPQVFLPISTHFTATPGIPRTARTLCITAAAGTELAGASSSGTVIIFPVERSLHPKGLHPPRGVAASGFPPLRKIPHCCLP